MLSTLNCFPAPKHSSYTHSEGHVYLALVECYQTPCLLHGFRTMQYQFGTTKKHRGCSIPLYAQIELLSNDIFHQISMTLVRKTSFVCLNQIMCNTRRLHKCEFLGRWITGRVCFIMAVSDSEERKWNIIGDVFNDSRFIYNTMTWCRHRNGLSSIMTNGLPSRIIQRYYLIKFLNRIHRVMLQSCSQNSRLNTVNSITYIYIYIYICSTLNGYCIANLCMFAAMISDNVTFLLYIKSPMESYMSESPYITESVKIFLYDNIISATVPSLS